MSGANISAGTVGQTQLSSGYVDLTNTQTIGGAKTFSVAPVMSGANISAGTVGQTQLSSGYVDLTNTQTIGGAKTFSVAPIMSGVNISSGTIPTSSVASGFVNTSTTQTIGGAKTFSVAPVMSGANISSNSISANCIIGGGGSNLFSTGISISGYYTSTTNALNVAGNASISGNVTAISYNATSDRRLKSNIQPLYSQWDKILNIEPVSFDWKIDGRQDIGFIAQNIYNTYPQLRPNYQNKDPSFNYEEPVDLSGNPIYYTIDYGRMTPFLWQGMKEIMHKLDRLETENKQLIERISKLES
jgi:hypothetical protein